MRITSSRLSAMMDYLHFLDRCAESKLFSDCPKCAKRIAEMQKHTQDAINEGTREGVVDNG